MPDTIPVDLLEPGGATTAAHAPRHHTLTEVLSRYGTYLALFVGAGLISGAVVHFPLAPTRYAVIGGVGAAVFAVASVLADRAGRDALGIARLAIASLALALGIGMVSGSIQHFQDIPERASKLVPIGLALSVAAFIVRNELRPKKDDLAAVALWAVVAVVALGLGLGRLADTMEAGGAGHGHGHGGEAAQTHGTQRSKDEPRASERRRDASPRKDAAGASGHDDDGHAH